MIDKYEQALLDGREVVIVVPDSDYNSSVFFMDTETYDIYVWSRVLGLFRHEHMTLADAARHFEKCKQEMGAQVFICGSED